MKEGEASCSEKIAQGKNTRVRIWKKIPVPPLPLKLSPPKLLHWDILRACLVPRTQAEHLRPEIRCTEANLQICLPRSKEHSCHRRGCQDSHTDKEDWWWTRGKCLWKVLEQRYLLMEPPSWSGCPGGVSCFPRVGQYCCDNFGPKCHVCLLVQNYSPRWEDGNSGIATGGPWCQVVWSMGEVCLQTQKVGFTCNFMQDKPGCLKSRESMRPLLAPQL